MALNYVVTAIEYYPDPTKGRPVFNGQIFIGEPDTDPEIELNRKEVTLQQEDGSLVVIPPEQQPLMTGAGGVVLYNGAYVQVLTDGNYSLKVLNSKGSQVYYIEDAFDVLVPNLSFEEQVSLTDGQTLVEFANISVNQAAIYVNGDSVDRGRLTLGVDYTITTTSSITLINTFPGGSFITAVQNDPVAEPNSGDILAFNNVEDAKAQSLVINTLFRTKGYYTAGDGGGATYLVAASQTVDGFGDHVMANGNVMLLQRVGNIFSVREYGARGDAEVANGTVTTGNDDSAAINAAANAYRSLIDSGSYVVNGGPTNPHSEQGATLFFPAGVYRSSSCLWFGSDIAGGATVRGGVRNVASEPGAMIVSDASGEIAIDFSGAWGIRWENLGLFGDKTSTPDVGVLLARSGNLSPNPSSGAHSFIQPRIFGNYNISSVYSYGSEVNRWVNPQIRNAKAGAYSAFYITSDNANRAVVSANTLVAVGSYQSTYGPVIIGGDIRFDVDGTGDNALMICESASFGPKVDGAYIDMLQGGITKTPFFLFSTASSTTGVQKRTQSPSLTNLQSEAQADSFVKLIDGAEVRELTIHGCSLPDSSSVEDSDIVVTDGCALRYPTIQPYKGTSSIEAVSYNLNSTGILENPALTYFSIDTDGYDFIESSLTLDAAWQTLDLSSIVPVNAREVSIKVEVNNTGVISNSFPASLREFGNTNSGNVFSAYPSVSGIINTFEGSVRVNNSQLEYNADSRYSRFRIKIRGYWA